MLPAQCSVCLPEVMLTQVADGQLAHSVFTRWPHCTSTNWYQGISKIYTDCGTHLDLKELDTVSKM